MAEEKSPNYLPEPYPLSPAELAAAYAKAKASFSAADLQRFTEVEEGIPMDQVLKELEEIHAKISQGGE